MFYTLTYHKAIEGIAISKNTDLIGGSLLLLAMFPTLIFSAAYSATISADVSIDAGTRAFVQVIPLLLVTFMIVLAAMLMYVALKRRR